MITSANFRLVAKNTIPKHKGRSSYNTSQVEGVYGRGVHFHPHVSQSQSEGRISLAIFMPARLWNKSPIWQAQDVCRGQKDKLPRSRGPQRDRDWNSLPFDKHRVSAEALWLPCTQATKSQSTTFPAWCPQCTEPNEITKTFEISCLCQQSVAYCNSNLCRGNGCNCKTPIDELITFSDVVTCVGATYFLVVIGYWWLSRGGAGIELHISEGMCQKHSEIKLNLWSA